MPGSEGDTVRKTSLRRNPCEKRGQSLQNRIAECTFAAPESQVHNAKVLRDCLVVGSLRQPYSPAESSTILPEGSGDGRFNPMVRGRLAAEVLGFWGSKILRFTILELRLAEQVGYYRNDSS